MQAIDRMVRSNLKLKHLQLLVALDQFRHLGRAADYLALTQPGVSKTLAEVERLFGPALFQRSTRGTEPTVHGLRVVHFARSVLADFERTRDELAAVSSGAAGRVNVGAMVLPPAWASSRAKLAQQFYKRPALAGGRDRNRLAPGDLHFLQQRQAIGFVARGVAQQAQLQGLARVLRIKVPVELPPVGLIYLRGRARSPVCEQLVAYLRAG